MRLNDAILAQEPKPLAVPFANDNVLNVTYKPAKFTVRELEEMTKKREVRALIVQLLRVIDSWDLEDSAGKVIPLEVDALLDIDVQVFTHIITKVSEDQRVSGEAASS